MYDSPKYFVFEFPCPLLALRPNPSLFVASNGRYGLGQPLPWPR